MEEVKDLVDQQEEEEESRAPSFVDQVFDSESYEYDEVKDPEEALRNLFEGCPIHETLRTAEGRRALREAVTKKKVVDADTRQHIQIALKLHTKKQAEKRKRTNRVSSSSVKRVAT